MLDFIPSPTGEAFQLSDKFIKLICGPVGGGKSTVALYDLWLRAFRQKPFKGVRRTRFIILRNTMGQLKSTVKPLIDQWFVAAFDGKAGSWRLSDNTFELRIALSDGTTIKSEFVMMAADTPDDVRRLLSLECSAAWVEECREVDQAVFEGLIGRVNRFPNRQSGGVTYPGLICSTNPPPMDTFWHHLMTDPPGNTGIFMQPPAVNEDGSFNQEAENLNNLNPGYYENLMDGKAKGWVDVYLRNKFGAGGFGEPVFKGVFNRDFHVTKEPLKPVYSGAHKIIVGSDNGLTAAAVIGQRDALGKVNVLDNAFVPDGETMGYERFLETLLIPKLRLLGVPNKDVLFMVDPACFTRSEATEVTIAMVIQRHGFAVQRAGSNSPEVRIRACEELLVKQIDGGPLLRVSPTAAHLVSALDWGYRYRKATAAGGDPTIDKNHFSHCFVAGTRVNTPTGYVPIEELVVGDMVSTPHGAQMVTATMSRGVNELVELEFDTGTTIVCTPDHLFFTERGLTRADTLEYTDSIVCKGVNLCPTPNTPSSISTALRSISSSLDTSKLASKSLGARFTCTGLSGSITTDLFQKVCMSITSTMTALTTPLKTLRSLPQRSTPPCTGENGGRTPATGSRRLNTSPASTLAQKPGTVALLAPSGTAVTLLLPGSAGCLTDWFAPTAGTGILGSKTWRVLGTAHSRALAWLERKLGLTTKHGSVLCAAQSSAPTNTEKQKPVAKLVRRSQRSLTGEPERLVYDLTVEHEHCFYVEDLLVSNCGDAFNYFCMYFASGKSADNWQSKKREIQNKAYCYA